MFIVFQLPHITNEQWPKDNGGISVSCSHIASSLCERASACTSGSVPEPIQ